MFDHRIVSPRFWMGRTGKALKAAGPEALIVGLYLITNQHTNMLGLYHLPLGYVAIDTGLGSEGASKGLAGAIEAGMCVYDEATDMVWVVEMAAWQVGDTLEPKDNRVKGIQRAYDALPENPFLARFYERYGQAFHMTSCRGSVKVGESPSEAPPKPGTGAGAGTEAGTGGKDSPANPPAAPAPAPAADAAGAAPKRGTRLSPDWTLPKAWGEWAVAKYPHWDRDTVLAIAGKFRNYWVARPGKDATKLDWYATWQNWCDSGITQKEHPPPRDGAVAAQAQVSASAAKAARLEAAMFATDGAVRPAASALEGAHG